MIIVITGSPFSGRSSMSVALLDYLPDIRQTPVLTNRQIDLTKLQEHSLVTADLVALDDANVLARNAYGNTQYCSDAFRHGVRYHIRRHIHDQV